MLRYHFVSTIVLFVTVFISPIIGVADEAGELTDGTIKRPPLVRTEERMVVEAWFPDGRIADMVVLQVEGDRFPIGLEVTENTCAKSPTSVRGTYHYGVAGTRLAWRWIEHYDAERVGKLLEARPEKDPTQPFVPYLTSQTDLMPSPLATLFPEHFKVPKDQLEFSNLQQLFGSELQPPYQVVSWTAETMLLNPETGLQENQIITDVAGVELSVSADGRLVLENFSAIESMLPLNLIGFLGEIVRWVVEGKDSSRCEITMQINAQDFVEGRQQFQAKEPELQQYHRPFIYPSEDVLKFYQAIFEIQYFYSMEFDSSMEVR